MKKREEGDTPNEDFLLDERKKDIDYVEHALFKPIFLNSSFIPSEAIGA